MESQCSLINENSIISLHKIVGFYISEISTSLSLQMSSVFPLSQNNVFFEITFSGNYSSKCLEFGELQGVYTSILKEAP
jgi:hypothetical protein